MSALTLESVGKIGQNAYKYFKEINAIKRAKGSRLTNENFNKIAVAEEKMKKAYKHYMIRAIALIRTIELNTDKNNREKKIKLIHALRALKNQRLTNNIKNEFARRTSRTVLNKFLTVLNTNYTAKLRRYQAAINAARARRQTNPNNNLLRQLEALPNNNAGNNLMRQLEALSNSNNNIMRQLEALSNSNYNNARSNSGSNSSYKTARSNSNTNN